MGKSNRHKKERIHKMTEEEYANYVMSLKDEKPIGAYRDEMNAQNYRDTSHSDQDK